MVRLLLTAACLSLGVNAAGLEQIDHVVLSMQENRAFDHYFGSMAGVRGFSDPNVQVNPGGRNTFQQIVTPSMSTAADQLTPWHLNYPGGTWPNATQCMGAGSNSWQAMHQALNGGLTNQWAAKNTPWSWGFFKRLDIETHWDVAEGFTVGDMYQEAILAATDPNRIAWMSGTINNPGSPNNPNGQNAGGMILDNTATPGCELPKFNCFPFTWKTIAEYLQDANVTWQVYQDTDNFEDNMLAYFKQYQAPSNDTTNPLTRYGNSYPGLQKFYDDAAAGTLPMVSYIIRPAELSEHGPYLPSDGGWLIKKVTDAVTTGAGYKNMALILSYDEVGGYGDHVTPFTAPEGTKGEWLDKDPYGEISGPVPIGPGFRLPFVIISPWTRGGNVFTEPADHNSQNLFLEKWLKTKGYSVHSNEIPTWRREHMSDLVNAFDFDHPDYSRPKIAQPPAPLRDTSKGDPKPGALGSLSGNYIGAATCQATYKDTQPPVPYGKANADADVSKLSEEGFKSVRGALTEGRYLTFEKAGFALSTTNDGRALAVARATAKHDDIRQRWVVHQQGAADSKTFTLSAAKSGKYITSGFQLGDDSSKAVKVTITDMGNAQGYRISLDGEQKGLGISPDGRLSAELQHAQAVKIFSVTYHQSVKYGIHAKIGVSKTNRIQSR